jgi:hypothetical protein
VADTIERSVSECDGRERKHAQQARWYEENKTRILADRRSYYETNKKTVIKRNHAYKRRRIATDPEYKLRNNLRKRLYMSIRRNAKAGSAVVDLGCSIPELKAHLESKFHPHPVTGEAMTWENWSRCGWHIDHVVALAKFDLTDRDQFLQAVNYKNLQPLWAEANLKKGARSG